MNTYRIVSVAEGHARKGRADYMMQLGERRAACGRVTRVYDETDGGKLLGQWEPAGDYDFALRRCPTRFRAESGAGGEQ